MRYYVEHNADDVSADVWAWSGNVSGNIDRKAQEKASDDAEAVESQTVISQRS
jgi:hypothetical protein